MKQWFKKNYIFILAFLIPTFLMVLVYSIRGVYPFGKNSVLVLDLNAQYVYYYQAFRDAFFDGKSLFYSFSRTLGGEMIGIYAYYLASPFSLLLLVFPKEYITEAVYCIIIMKVGTAALTFSIYLRSSRNAKNLNLLMFSIMYALMSYMVVQTMNPMWLDGLILLPIIILSVEKLINQGKFILLIVSLTALFITNFYIGYMTGIFVFFYFLYYLFGKSQLITLKGKLKKLFIFSASTLLAVGSSMWLLLPTYYSLKMGKLTFSTPDFNPLQKLDLFDLFSKMLFGTYDSVNYEGYPFIFCGTIVLILTVYYFASKNIATKEKIAAATMITVFIICFTISTIDIALHGFQPPNWLNFRYSFILSFFLLTLSYDAFKEVRTLDNKTIAKVLLVFIFLVAYIGKSNYTFIVPEINIWLSYLFLIVYSLLLYCFKNTTKRRLLGILFIIVVSTEMFINASLMINGADIEVSYSSRPSYRNYFDRLTPAVDYLEKHDTSFYRTETILKRTVNDSMALGTNGISHSSSTLNSDVIDMFYNLGFSSKEHWTRYKGFTILTDSLFGLKYILAETKINNWYRPTFIDDAITVYENPYALPIAFVANKTYATVELESTNPFINQNQLLSSLLGQTDTEFFKMLPVQKTLLENMIGRKQGAFTSYTAKDPSIDAHIEYVLETAGDNEMYLYLYSEYPRKVSLSKGKELLDIFFDHESTCIIPIGANPDVETISIIATPTEAEYYLNEYMFYYLDTPLFESAISELKARKVIVTKQNETHINIVTTSNDEDVLFTSIPYDRGWRAQINGKKVETLKTIDSLLSVPLGAGEQKIEFTFIPYGFISGSILSGLSIVIFVILLFRHNRKNKSIQVKNEAIIIVSQ